MKKQFVIVGGGLSGLAAAVNLKNRGIQDFILIEKEKEVGGRVKTSEIDGFKLDHGFQVYLPSYENSGKLLDLRSLDLQFFDKGASILIGDKKLPFFAPEAGLGKLIHTAYAGPGSVMDKLKLNKHQKRVVSMTDEAIFAEPSTPSFTYLKRLGYSDEFVNLFWKPFYQSVFLENELSSSSRMLNFTLKHFAQQSTAVPAKGMQEIPKQLVSHLTADQLRLGHEVVSIENGIVKTDQGESIEADLVLNANANISKEKVAFHAVTNFYFAAPSFDAGAKQIILNANHQRLVNNIVPMTKVAKEYGDGKHELISVSANGNWENKESEVINELVSLLGEEVKSWKLVQSFLIEAALPKVNVPLYDKEYPIENGEILFGDYQLYPSIDGAMRAGIMASETALQELALV